MSEARWKRLVLVFISSGIILMGSSEKVMSQNYSTEGALAPCGTKPNCVSSQNTSDRHRTEPFKLNSTGPAVLRKLQAIISDLPGTTIIRAEDHYLHAEFKSRLFGFVDDLEFVVNEQKGRVDVRSASRVGYYDFGANRRRVEKIRSLYDQE